MRYRPARSWRIAKFPTESVTPTRDRTVSTKISRESSPRFDVTFRALSMNIRRTSADRTLLLSRPLRILPTKPARAGTESAPCAPARLAVVIAATAKAATANERINEVGIGVFGARVYTIAVG